MTVIVVALGKKLLVMQWRHSAAWTAWCPASDTDTVDGFQYIREIQVSESPTLLTLVDSSLGGSGGGVESSHICVGYRHQFDLVNERSGEVSRLHSVEGSRSHLVAAIDLYEDEEPELLLCYNHTCHFQKISEENVRTEFDFHWNSVPSAIGRDYQSTLAQSTMSSESHCYTCSDRVGAKTCVACRHIFNNDIVYVCAFPYIFAFTTDSMEIRLIINGNLVQNMIMPKLTLICSKVQMVWL
uniref:CNH domain-containing protein n=1 Tax=Timema monikensis TaxID=170555 RepID=A0A7R9EH08_9NEOP|nr:unnamed protein product [Timema monikensis]